ncbi:MAG: ATP-binding protein, partial [Actinomycetota bacterium]
QEALVYIEKHSKAEQVQIAWTVSEGRGVLVVEDNGRGFDPAKGIRGSAYGLVGMRERAASVGAVLEISSEIGQGTTITVQTSQPSEQVKKT